ncbi:hypothetical protein PIB30_068742 [Stylosanthes scabra]|uniref:Uncharacterized protein n=1 Tax=Stylosanthes scabra TaxID=79078 RepID=A0ABU6RNE0_9FABA|nr:hypothetical protein [Stylosanthes scabra]
MEETYLYDQGYTPWNPPPYQHHVPQYNAHQYNGFGDAYYGYEDSPPPNFNNSSIASQPLNSRDLPSQALSIPRGRIDEEEAENRRNRAVRACTPHRKIARYPGSHSSGFCPHRAAARLTRATTRSKVKSGVNADRAPARSPPHDRMVASGRKLMKAKIGISSIWVRAKPL